MTDPYSKLRQFNEVWNNRRLFTACIEFMFWYETLDNAEEGAGLSEIEKSYWAMVEAIQPRINFFSKSESSKRSKLKRDSLDLFAYSLRHAQVKGLPNAIRFPVEEGGYMPIEQLDFGGINQVTLLQGGEHDKSDVFVDAHVTGLSYQRFGLTIEEVVADPAAYVRLCIEAIAGAKFRSGFGGFSFNYVDVYINGNDQLTTPVAGRFKGVNLIHAWRYRKLDGVPTVNWLTVVSTADLDRLGGWDAVAARVHEPVVMHRLPHGALFQAGPTPLLGDVNEQERLDAYYAVGALLAPVRSTLTIQSSVVNGSREDTIAWMNRFYTQPT